MANVSSSNGLEKRPKLRFPGFDEPWRTAQLGDLLIELSDYATQESGFPLLTSSRQGLFVQEDYFTDKQANAETTAFSVLPYGCITYRHMSDDNIFHFNINRLVANGLVSKEYPVFTVRKDVLDTDFLVDTLNSSPLFSVFCIQQKKGGTRTRLYFKTLCSYQMFLPALHEQQVIASFIRLLDKRIERQVELVETLKKYKRGAVDGLLAKKIRFCSRGEWAELKISDLFSPVSDKGHSDLTVLTIIQGVGTLPRDCVDRRIMYDKASTNTYKRVEKNDFILHLRSFEGGLELANSVGIVSPAYTILRANKVISPSFYYAYFRSYWFISNKLRMAVEGIRDGKSINMNTFWNIAVPYPSLEEQSQIAEYLHAMDLRLSNAIQELESLIQIRNGLMQQLFI